MANAQAATTLLRARPVDPDWCSGHYEPSPREAFHQHSFERAWGAFDEKIRLGITRFDSDGRAGDERVEVQYLTDITEVQGSVSLTDGEATELVGDVLYVLARKRSASGSRLALLLRCAYEAGKALAAAVRSSRTSAPRTASSHSRSISAM
jgi:hypothetical protein